MADRRATGLGVNILPTDVNLFLSGRCNLSCGYCYQMGGPRSGAMPWRTARKALEWLLSSGSGVVLVEFNGGEPLLEMVTLRRAVEFVETHRAPGRTVQFGITTNGTLLTPETLGFLFEHGFTIHVSCDGVEAAQRLRGEGTFEVLDRLLDRIRENHTEQLTSHVKILLTVTAATIPHLSASIRYLLAKGVQAIGIAPRLTFDPDWRASCREDLERQVDEVVRLSLDHWRRTDTVPVGFLAGARRPGAGAPAGELLCGVSAARSLSVDPSGRVWACPLFASSLQELPPMARQASRALDLGAISGRSFPRRIATLPGRVAKLRAFNERLAKRSASDRCADCRFVAECHVCPGSITHNSHNTDPDLVPDFVCAFNYVTLSARDRFDDMTGGKISQASNARFDEALRNLRESVEASLGELLAQRERRM